MKKIITLLFLFLSVLVTAQFGPQQIISNLADGANSVVSYDVDNDGFIDVISASAIDKKIAWYRNLDGHGNFGFEQIISMETTPVNLEMYDVDGDGLDDLVFYNWQNKIVWLKNLDGKGGFSDENVITTNTDIYNYKLFDFNGNGHLDIIAILNNSTFDERLVWYENIDGNGNFSEENLISVGNYFNGNLAIVDLNNDGLLDIITSIDDGYSPSIVVWIENLGNANYAIQQVVFQFEFLSAWMQVIAIYTADLTGNGLNDLVIAAQHDDFHELDGLYWLENIDGNGFFSPPVVIDQGYNNYSSVRFYDLDDDGNIDILTSRGFSSNGTVSWFKNLDGQGSFGPEQIITTQVQSARDAKAADLNGNGFLDVISASFFDDKIAWYANQILSTNDFNKTHFTLYPNPTPDYINIQTTEIVSKITLHNVQGRTLDFVLVSDKIDISNLAPGVYFLKIKFDNNSEVNKKIIKL